MQLGLSAPRLLLHTGQMSDDSANSGTPAPVPSAEGDWVRSELSSFLESDESRLGEVFRLTNKGMTANEIANELDVSTPNFVYNYTAIIKTLLDGDIPNGPSVALQAARRFRAILKTVPGLSAPTRSYLEDRLGLLERQAEDPDARVREPEELKSKTVAAEATNEAGIYVYALPHYLRYPFDPETGRTLLKVGRSDSHVIQRFKSQTRTTALPEEPVLPRIYRTDAESTTSTVEADFHRLLQAADMPRSIARTAGKEWFVTSVKFLDEVARVMGLDTVIVNDSASDDDA